ncbi:MAG TPA: hypothetical protein VGO07_05585 [Candidatus Saccharimonadales bacterium]|jgi:hypothetical protein|nr:hypothetical protein [Candidatus Saccharimonadales bacterium]
MLSKYKSIRNLAMMALMLAATLATAQTTATGVINATLVNKNGISLQFDTDPGGITLGAAGTNAATANFGAVSAFGPLSGGVTRPTVTAASYTVRTIFDVQVVQGGLTSTTYTLTANLAAAAPTGLNYKVDAVTLTAASQTIQINGAYNTAIAHNLDLVISTAAPGAGGPAVGTPITTTINFTATAN